jgi:hypothetical protein
MKTAYDMYISCAIETIYSILSFVTEGHAWINSL